MAQSSRFRLIMFGSLYFVQGVALAYFRNFQKPYLDSVGLDADVIGLLTTILLLPFVLKIFIGMFSDRTSLFGRGHRRPYIVLGLILAALAFGAAAFIAPDANFALFALAIVMGSFSVALFDSTTDGLAIDTTPASEQGRVQSTMVGSRALGFILLSLVFGALVSSAGYRVVFLIIAAAMLIPLWWVRRAEEPDERDVTRTFDWRAFRALGQPQFIVFAVYAIVYSVVSFGIDGLVTFFMSQQLGAPETSIGTYGALRGTGAVLGALAAGVLVDRIGRRTAAYGAAVLVLVFGFLFSVTGSLNPVLLLGLVWGLAWGFQETVFVALAMALADIRIAASMFAIMMALSNIGTAIGEGVATGMTDNVGFAAVFQGLALGNLLIFPILWLLFRIAPGLVRSPAPSPMPAD